MSAVESDSERPDLVVRFWESMAGKLIVETRLVDEKEDTTISLVEADWPETIPRGAERTFFVGAVELGHVPRPHESPFFVQGGAGGSAN